MSPSLHVKRFKWYNLDKSNNCDWRCFISAIFAVSKILLRSTVKIRKLESWILITISFVRVRSFGTYELINWSKSLWPNYLIVSFQFACIAYYCGAVAVFAETDIILLTSIFLFLSHVFFTVTPHFVDVRNTCKLKKLQLKFIADIHFFLLPPLLFSKVWCPQFWNCGNVRRSKFDVFTPARTSIHD